MAKTLAPRSIRLTFRYGPAGVQLVRRVFRRSPAPPGVRLIDDVPAGAVVLELQNAQGTVRFRVFLPNPIPQSVETADAVGALRRSGYVKPAGAFAVVTPVPDERGWVAVVRAGPAVTLRQPGLEGVGQPGQWRELVRATLEGGRDGRN